MTGTTSWPGRLRRALGWWFAALTDRRGWFPGSRLIIAGLLVGFLVGWSTGYRYRVVVIEETSLPRPVIDPPPGLRWVRALTTGYCPCFRCCGLFADGRTAINREVSKFPFGLAVAKSLIPFRTLVDVPGYGLAMVDDTGGAMRQDATRGVVHLDLRFVGHQQARQWGRRWLWLALPAASGAAVLAPPVR